MELMGRSWLDQDWPGSQVCDGAGQASEDCQVAAARGSEEKETGAYPTKESRAQI